MAQTPPFVTALVAREHSARCNLAHLSNFGVWRGGFLFPASGTVAIAAVQNHTKMSPSAVAQGAQTLEREQF